jgi:hypothetical protein
MLMQKSHKNYVEKNADKYIEKRLGVGMSI